MKELLQLMLELVIIKNATTSERLFVITYQWYLITAWFMPSLIGNWMTYIGAKKFRAPFVRKSINEPEKIHRHMNYLYFYVWKRILTKNLQFLMFAKPYPQCPIWFAYGLKNPMKFHDDNFANMLKSRTDCKYVPYPEAGHWLMLDESQKFHQQVKEWLNETDKLAKL